MARKVTLIDDLDGQSEGAETYRLVIGERTWLIDLIPDNFAKLEKSVERFTKKGRETTPSRSSAPDSYAGVDQGAVRQWAQENGLDVQDKGRVPLDVVNAYNRAMSEADDANEEPESEPATEEPQTDQPQLVSA